MVLGIYAYFLLVLDRLGIGSNKVMFSQIEDLKNILQGLAI